VNLLLVHHGGIAFTQTEREVRYEVETLLASDCIAVAGGPYVEGVPEFALDLVDQGPLPGARMIDMPGVQAPPTDPLRGSSFDSAVDVADIALGGASGDGSRIVAGYVYLRRPYEREQILVGEFRSVIGSDFTSSVKLAEMVAALIRRGLST
jgi:hypothetical protein